jgi:hypothetical protein
VNAQQTPRPATTNQVDTLKRMLGELAEFDQDTARATWLSLRERQASHGLDFATVSEAIGNVGDALRAHRQSRPVAEDVPDVPAGSYAVDTDEGHLAFYKVWRPQDGAKRYAVYVLASDDEHRLLKPTALAVLRKIAEDPYAALTRYGREIGECGECHRTLTNEASRAAGIGPVCAAKRG